MSTKVVRDLTPREVGKICGVSRGTASRWVDQGLLDGYRIPHPNPNRSVRRIPPHSLEKFLSEHIIGRNDDPLFLMSEVSEILLLSSQFFRRIFDSGLIQGYRDSTKWAQGCRITPCSDLVSFIQRYSSELPPSFFFPRLFDFIEKKKKPRNVAYALTRNKEAFPLNRSVAYCHAHRTEIPEEYSARLIGRYALSMENKDDKNFWELADYLANVLR